MVVVVVVMVQGGEACQTRPHKSKPWSFKSTIDRVIVHGLKTALFSLIRGFDKRACHGSFVSLALYVDDVPYSPNVSLRQSESLEWLIFKS